MNKRPLPLAWVSMLLFLLMIACSDDQSPKVFEKHLADNPDINKKYIYKSLLRLANVKQDPDFNKLIKDVDKIIIYFPPKADSTYHLKDLRSTLREQNYEELIDMRTAEKERITLWLNESLPQPHYVGLLDTSSDDFIFEIDGVINLEYISSLNMADQSSLRALLN